MSSNFFETLQREQEEFQGMSCSELSSYLDQNWAQLLEGRRTYLCSLMAEKGCIKARPLLIELLESHDLFARERALRDLAVLQSREYRKTFINMHLTDSVSEVRATALLELGNMFRGKQDIEILQLALDAFDNVESDLEMRLFAGATMMYQLGIPHDSQGRPAWWDDDNVEELEHPAIQKAVFQTRKLVR